MSAPAGSSEAIARILFDTDEPGRGAVGEGAMTLEEWDKLGDGERMELYRSDRDLWLAMTVAERERGVQRLVGE